MTDICSSNKLLTPGATQQAEQILASRSSTQPTQPTSKHGIEAIQILKFRFYHLYRPSNDLLILIL